jgi:hypothetical protein
VAVDDLFRRTEIALGPFVRAADDFFANLFENRLPADWRGQWHAFVAGQAAEGYVVEPQSAGELEAWIEVWARNWKLLPGGVEPDAAMPPATSAPGSGDAVVDLVNRQAVESWSPEGLGVALSPGQFPQRAVPVAAAAPRVVDVRVRKGIGGWYDEAVVDGQYEPGFVTRVAVAIVRVFFPDSEPSTTIIYSDGTELSMLGGGPSSGAMGAQAGAVYGVVSAASNGKLLLEATETAVDTAFQEATGSPVGPSVIKSDRSQA